jgi:hypothetical protein
MFEKLLVYLLTISLLSFPVLANAPNCRPTQYYNSSNNQCLNCPSACASCNNSSSCAQCNTGYFNSSATTCLPCSTNNCAICPGDTCIFCSNRYELNDKGGCSPVNSSLFLTYLVGGVCLAVIFFVACCCYCINRCRQHSLFVSRVHRIAEVSRLSAPS